MYFLVIGEFAAGATSRRQFCLLRTLSQHRNVTGKLGKSIFWATVPFRIVRIRQTGPGLWQYVYCIRSNRNAHEKNSTVPLMGQTHQDRIMGGAHGTFSGIFTVKRVFTPPYKFYVLLFIFFVFVTLLPFLCACTAHKEC